MKFSAAAATLFAATPLLAAPVTSDANAGQDIELSKVLRRSLHTAVINPNAQEDVEISKVLNRSLKDWFTGGANSATTKPKPVNETLDGLFKGGDAGDACLSLIGNSNLAGEISSLVKSGQSGHYKSGISSLVSNSSFRDQIGALADNDAFQDKLFSTISNSDILGEAYKLGGDKDVVKSLFSTFGNANIGDLTAGYDGNYDVAGGLTTLLQGDLLTKFGASLGASGGGGGDIIAKITDVLGDKDIIGDITGLINGDGSFAANLGGLLQGGDFVSKVCGTLDLDSDLTANLTNLFSGNVDFGTELEGLLGGDFGGLANIVGSGDITAVLEGFLGGSAFADLGGNLFANGDLLGKITGLLKQNSFLATLTTDITALFSGDFDLSAFIGQIGGQSDFLGKICGVFDVPFETLNKLLSVTHKGFKSIFGFKA